MIQQAKTLFRDHALLVTIITAMATVCASTVTAYFTSRTATVNAQPEILKILQNDNRSLKEDIKALGIELKHLSVEYTRLQEDFYQLQRDNTSKLNQIEALKKALIAQASNSYTLQAWAENMPWPAWLKDLDSRMIFINDAYQREYNVSQWQYEGHTDFDNWPKEVAVIFVENDQRVIECKCSIITQEYIPGVAREPISELNKLVLWEVWKWPVLNTEKKVTGVAGIAFRVLEN